MPNLPRDQIVGVEITRLGRRVYRGALVPHRDPRSRAHYWIGGEAPTGVVEEGADIGALARNWVSITLIHLDLTEYGLIEELKKKKPGFERQSRVSEGQFRRLLEGY